MKKNDIILITAVLLYSLLFYKQTAGINFLIYSIFLLLALVIINPESIKSKTWLAAAACSILSGFSVFLYGSSLSIFANILSLTITAVYTVSKDSSFLPAAVYGFYSYFSSIIFMLINLQKKKNAAVEEKQYSYSKILITIIPILVVLIFFFLYREGNPVFKKFTAELDFSINPDFIRFTLLGFIVLYGFFYPRIIPQLHFADQICSDNLYPGNETSEKSLKNLNYSGILLLVMLNLLLMLVNIVDVNYLFISDTIPGDITYAEFVHQGVYTLIISIVLAIAIILFYFRGDLNFYSKNTVLKTLALIWIIQNAFLAALSACKNGIYIAEYSLTYKRIGVYIYLLLTVIGLIITLTKILAVKSNLFLIRKNSWAFYMVLIISCLINWDAIIIQYNTRQSDDPDKEYLYTLGDEALPYLVSVCKEPVFESDETEFMFNYQVHQRKKEFLEEYQNMNWQSWNLKKENIYDQLTGK